MIRKLLVTLICVFTGFVWGFIVTRIDVQEPNLHLFIFYVGIVLIASGGVRLTQSKPKPRHATKNVIFDFEGNK